MKILVTGKNGLVGSALRRVKTDHKMVFVGKNEADLTKESEVKPLFRILKPDCVIHTAALVGGIGGNISCPGSYFYNNVLMNSHIIHFAREYGVKKLLAFSSVCVFPDGIPVLREDLMHKGEPFHTQYAYGASKRAIDTQITAYKAQYKIDNYSSIIPCNIFGKDDNYDVQWGHVIPSLIHKIHLAKAQRIPLKVWGDGSAKREFIYSDDMARIIMQIVDLDVIPQRILVSRDTEITIKEVVDKLCKAADFKNGIIWETDKPNGQAARPSDLSLLRSLIGEPKYTDIDEALAESYRWFAENYPYVRPLG